MRPRHEPFEAPKHARLVVPSGKPVGPRVHRLVSQLRPPQVRPPTEQVLVLPPQRLLTCPLNPRRVEGRPLSKAPRQFLNALRVLEALREL